MPREQLRALAADVNRLLAAGSSSVAGDEGLGRRAQALHALATKVPALRPIAESIARALVADAPTAARALLDLAMIVGQARAALATAGVEGAAEPVGPAGPWATDAPAHDVYAVARSLAATGPGRVQVVREVVDRGAFLDLRLLGPLTDGLADPFGELADLIAEQALPAFGPAALPTLLGRRDLRGPAGSRRVRAIFAIDPGAGLGEFIRLDRTDPGGLLADRGLTLRELFTAAAARRKIRGGDGDPRWVPLIVGFLVGPHGAWAEKALAKLPKPSSSMLPILMGELDLDGSSADARRLEAIVALDPEAGLALCRRAIAEGGGPEVRAQSLRCLAEADPAGAGRVARDLLRADGHAASTLPAPVRVAAMGCVQVLGDDKALESALRSALLRKTLDSERARKVAADALAALDHPGATDRLLRELQKQADLAKLAREEDALAALRGALLLRALKGRADPAAASTLAALLKHPVEAIRRNAAEALAKACGPKERAQALALLRHPKFWEDGLAFAWNLPPAEHFETLAPLLGGMTGKAKRDREVAEEIISFFRLTYWHDPGRAGWDPRWVGVLRGYLLGPKLRTQVADPREDSAYGMALILGRGAIPDLIRALPIAMREGNSGVTTVLGRMGAREAFGPILEHAAEAKYLHEPAETLKAICGPEDLRAIRATRDRLSKPGHLRAIDDLIRHLTSGPNTKD